jgi:16S rRNA (guanine(966)-N(2))-methyltransferase RsmD
MLESLLVANRPGTLVSTEPREPGQPELWAGLTILDLYAGTGALGIEALSRGAAWCDFVEHNVSARRTIDRNLRTTGFLDRAHVTRLDVDKVLHGSALSALRAPYAVALLDPPYAATDISANIAHLADRRLLEPEGLVGVEHSPKVTLAGSFEEVPRGDNPPVTFSLVRVRERRHGDTVLSVYRWVPTGDRGEDEDGYQGDLSGQL